MGNQQDQVIEAIVYYIPAAASIELYVPSIRSCTPIHLRVDGMPSRAELEADAEDIVDRHFAMPGRIRPPGHVQLEFRVPRDDEMLEPAPPHPAGRVGYGVQGFGHIDPGYIRSTQPRPPGTEPVPCPTSWFTSTE